MSAPGQPGWNLTARVVIAWLRAPIVRVLQQALGDLDQNVLIDSSQLRGGGPLKREIESHRANPQCVTSTG